MLLADTCIKRFGENGFKITVFKRNFESFAENYNRSFEPRKKPEPTSSDRFRSAVSRARNTVIELCLCNEWELFGTFTLDKNKVESREDLEAFKKRLTAWLRAYGRYHSCRISYVLVPEQHADGAWHMHGLLCGIPSSALSEFVRGVHPQKLIDGGYKNWEAYRKKFGFCSFGEINDIVKASNYVAEYIKKSVDVQTAVEGGKHLYLCSQGLQRAERVYSGWALVHDSGYTDTAWANDWLYSKFYSPSDAPNLDQLVNITPEITLE